MQLYDIIVQLVSAVVSSLGFALLFHVRKGLLLPSAMGGLVCWGVYLIASVHMEGIFYPSLLAAACTALYAETLARLLRAPTPVFFVPAVIPLIPGSSLYYTMSAAVQGDMALAAYYGNRTILFVLALAAGASIIWAACDMSRKLLALRRH